MTMFQFVTNVALALVALLVAFSDMDVWLRVAAGLAVVFYLLVQLIEILRLFNMHEESEE